MRKTNKCKETLINASASKISISYLLTTHVSNNVIHK